MFGSYVSHSLLLLITYSKSACSKASSIIQEILDKNGFNEEKKVADLSHMKAPATVAAAVVESAPVKSAPVAIDESKLSKSALRRKRRKEREIESGVAGDKDEGVEDNDTPTDEKALSPVQDNVYTNKVLEPIPNKSTVTPTSIAVPVVVDIPALVNNSAASIAAADTAFFTSLMSTLPKFPDAAAATHQLPLPVNSVPLIPTDNTPSLPKQAPVSAIAPPGFNSSGLGLGSLAAPIQNSMPSLAPPPSLLNTSGLFETSRLSMNPTSLYPPQAFPMGGNGLSFPQASNL